MKHHTEDKDGFAQNDTTGTLCTYTGPGEFFIAFDRQESPVFTLDSREARMLADALMDAGYWPAAFEELRETFKKLGDLA